jgi:acetyl-CoA carboxylase alpha subunit
MKKKPESKILIATQFTKSDHEKVKNFAEAMRLSISDLIRVSVFEKIFRETTQFSQTNKGV